MKVRDIMTTGVETAAPDTSLQEIAAMMKRDDVGAIPVVDGDELTGIITDRDIVLRCIAAGEDPGETNAEDILSEELHTVEPDDDIQDAARIMSEQQIRRLPVCEDGTLVGVISIGDIAVKQDDRTAGEALEDISEGVKGRSASRRRREPALAEPGKALGSRGKVQAISKRVRGDEMERQQRVNPQRAAAGSSGRKRRKAS